MDHVEGSVDQDPAWPGQTPDRRRRALRARWPTCWPACTGVDWRGLGLADFGKEGNYIARQIRRWSGQYEASRTDEIPEMDRLLAWLPDHLPDDDETAIVHGDYRPGNLIVHPDEPRIAAVLDWELSTLGHPLSDLAHNCLAFSIPRGASALPGLGGADFAALGLPAEDAYRDAYCERAGRGPIPEWRFYMAFAFFRMAAICQGVYARGLKGNASAPNAHEYGDRAPRSRRAGVGQGDGERLGAPLTRRAAVAACRAPVRDGRAQRNWASVAELDSVVLAVPGDEAGDALGDRRLRRVAVVALERRDVGPGLLHIAGLHRRVLDHGLAADGLLQCSDEVGERLGPVVADVVEAVGHAAVSRRRRVEYAQDRRHHVVDIGEIALHAAAVEERDGPALQDRPGEEEIGHIGPPPGP